MPMFVSVRTEQTVTTSLGSARAGQDLQANNVSKVSSNMTSFFYCSNGGRVYFSILCRNRLLNEVLMSARQQPQAPYIIHWEKAVSPECCTVQE